MVEFRLLTWNLNNFQISAAAPSSWNIQKNYKAIMDILVREKPDFVALQEVNAEQNIALIAKHLDMTYLQPVYSHSGLTCLIVNKAYEIDLVMQRPPSVICQLEIEGIDLVVGSCHLYPFKENNDRRYQYLERLLSEIDAPHLMLAGDMNMREAETRAILDFGVKDAYFESGMSTEHKFTWDSRINKFWERGFEYTARFDRVFYHGFEVNEFYLVGNQPLKNANHYLSDHFGIATTFVLS